LTYTLTNTGVKAAYPDESECENPSVVIPGIDGKYQALQFHIHTSSEHTIDGKFFGAELHTVHAEVGGDRYAVVGMMIHPDGDEENEMFSALLKGWQPIYDANIANCANETSRRAEQERELESQIFAPYQLIPDGATFYHYDGGLTTPPCSEVVWWNLADKAVSVTPGQYHELAELVLGYTDPVTCELGSNAGSFGTTSRPVQPLNGRTVERICPVGFEEALC
jgi:carbonic anhydrase